VLLGFRNERLEVLQACFGRVRAAWFMFAIGYVSLPVDSLQLTKLTTHIGGVVLGR